MWEPEDKADDIETAVVPAFRYDDLPRTVAVQVKAHAEGIRRLSARIAEDIIRIGGHLYAVRDSLDNGFSAWIDLEFAFGRSTAYKMIQTFEAFDGQDVANFDQTALYVLAEPRVPKEIRQLAMLMAKSERITATLAREIVGARKQPPPTNREVKAYAKLFPEDDDPDDPGSNLVRDHRLLMATLKAVIQNSTMIVIQRVIDTDADDDKVKSAAAAEGQYGKGREDEQSLAVPVLLTVYRDGEKPQTFTSAESIEIMILRAGGVSPMQKCAGPCGETKELLVHFGKKANKGIGRCLRCKKCEAARVKKAKDDKKKRQEAAQSRRSVLPAEEPAESPTAA